MPSPIDTRISLDLHADSIKAVDGFDETTAPLLAPAIEALDDAYITLGKLTDAREHAGRNKAWTEGQAILNVSDAAGRQQQRLSKKFDNVRVTLEKQIVHFEEQLSQPLEARAGATVSAEIRRFVKDMAIEERHKFLQQAIDDADYITVSAVLGAPSYLSGLDAKFAAVYTRSWWERTTPELAQKLKAVRGAKAHIEQRGGLVLKGIEKAMGSTWATVNELRQGNDKALEALKFGA